ncbi:MAG: hypothetical protein IPK26_13195 [Planctomycetes bacterium]|nr:hypothetical protein [Planctomycetota bacterium]
MTKMLLLPASMPWLGVAAEPAAQGRRYEVMGFGCWYGPFLLESLAPGTSLQCRTTGRKAGRWRVEFDDWPVGYIESALPLSAMQVDYVSVDALGRHRLFVEVECGGGSHRAHVDQLLP